MAIVAGGRPRRASSSSPPAAVTGELDQRRAPARRPRARPAHGHRRSDRSPPRAVSAGSSSGQRARARRPRAAGHDAPAPGRPTPRHAVARRYAAARGCRRRHGRLTPPSEVTARRRVRIGLARQRRRDLDQVAARRSPPSAWIAAMRTCVAGSTWSPRATALAPPRRCAGGRGCRRRNSAPTHRYRRAPPAAARCAPGSSHGRARAPRRRGRAALRCASAATSTRRSRPGRSSTGSCSMRGAAHVRRDRPPPPRARRRRSAS